MTVAIINFRMGNTFSVRQTVEKMGYEVFISNHPDELKKASKIILPGVGSFDKAMKNLNAGGWVEKLSKLVIQDNKPLLGICLGMQLLATKSHENSYVFVFQVLNVLTT